MVLIRPVLPTDLQPLLDLASIAGVGLTTLPKDSELLRRRILKSQRSIENIPDRPGGESYLFVMEDTDTGRVVGASGIVSKVGGFEPFYAYRIDKETHESELLAVHTDVSLLSLVREHNGPCEIGSLFLHPDYRGKSHGKLLQLVRFLFIAEHPEAFEPLVVSEMRGMIDDQGHSPFWDAVGRHFFAIDFPRADYLSVVNKKFIADLMPRHPLYVPLLPAAAQQVIGQVHEQSRAALKNLEAEGFTFSGMVDIFDAGAIVSCRRDDIRSVKASRTVLLAAVGPTPPQAPQFILAASGAAGPDFRACLAPVDIDAQGQMRISSSTAQLLGVKSGDRLRLAPAPWGPPMTIQNFIAGRWLSGQASPLLAVDDAVAAARQAAGPWAGLDAQHRIAAIGRIAAAYQARRAELIDAICVQTGKPRWEAGAEVDSMIAKVPASVAALRSRRAEDDSTHYKPHGVLAVLGPFNMPGHLPNGHIIPALLAGNTIIFKPSELTPQVAQVMARAWEASDMPPGVVNVVQGGPRIGSALARQDGIDGLLFTGSYAVGVQLSTLFAGRPEKILALEMGGNNPLVVWNAADARAAACLTIQSAFITSGQRCSCARRLIVGPDADAFLETLVTMMAALRVGLYTDDPEPFMGPVISEAAAQKLLAAQADLLRRGARSIVPMKPLGRLPALLSPGLIDVTAVHDPPDEEIFGPLLQLVSVIDFDAAITQANRTRYGLVAGLLSDDRSLFDHFRRRVRAGIVNWNRPMTGAGPHLPFGGVGRSGNHRPAGSWSADYCSWPVASTVAEKLAVPEKLPPGLEMRQNETK